MADPIRTCASCAEQLPADAPGHRHYCSTRCGKAARRRAEGVKPRWCDEGPASHQTHQCVVCDKEFKPKRAGRSTTCSRACGLAWTGEKRRARFPVAVTLRLRRCDPCGALFAQKRTERSCSRACAEDRLRMHSRAYYEGKSDKDDTPRPCLECGVPFSPAYGDRRRSYCSELCRTRALRRTVKKRRRAKERGVEAESVNPLKVFQRDGYRCQLCGNKTLKSKRGSHHPRAPELDHIEPLAKGGHHTYRNTQTACRQCNHAKSDGPGGQLLLFG